MKTCVVLAAIIALTVGAPSRNHHQHHKHKRAVTVTVVEYAGVTKAASPIHTPSAIPIAHENLASLHVSSQGPASKSYSAQNAALSSSTNTVPSKSSSTTEASKATGSKILGDLKLFSDPSEEFQDGVHDCDSLPTGQGVIGVDWISELSGGFSTIMNEKGDTSFKCTDGFYCSYACQAGMSKTQWPDEQPASGISVGGLLCKNGKLFRSRPSEKDLCTWGKESAHFISEVSKDISICRTDYPGSENMNIPTLLQAGSKAPVSVVDQSLYYLTHKGQETTTQYYVNNAGVAVEDGCIWSTEDTDVGNWAPLVIGAGYKDGLTYLSLIPNPNNKVAPNFNVKIEATPGSSVVGECWYIDGKFSGNNGCTLTVTKGSANFVFF